MFGFVSFVSILTETKHFHVLGVFFKEIFNFPLGFTVVRTLVTFLGFRGLSWVSFGLVVSLKSDFNRSSNAYAVMLHLVVRYSP